MKDAGIIEVQPHEGIPWARLRQRAECHEGIGIGMDSNLTGEQVMYLREQPGIHRETGIDALFLHYYITGKDSPVSFYIDGDPEEFRTAGSEAGKVLTLIIPGTFYAAKDEIVFLSGTFRMVWHYRPKDAPYPLTAEESIEWEETALALAERNAALRVQKKGDALPLDFSICPECGKKFVLARADSIYDSKTCSARVRQRRAYRKGLTSV